VLLLQCTNITEQQPTSAHSGLKAAALQLQNIKQQQQQQQPV
jgi:hypothetical protein